MAIDLAKLVVTMEANTAKFQKDMERVNGRLSRFERSAKASIRNIATVFASLGLGLLIRESIKFADTIGDTAKQTGLAARSYQELRYAASQLDVDTQSLDAALIKFNKNLGDARRGNKEAAKSFKELGLDPAQFKNTDEAFAAVTQRLGQVEDGFVRVSLQSAIFGKAAGPELASFLGASADEVARLRVEAHTLGAVLSDDVLDRADGAQKKLDSLALVLKTQLSVSAVEAAPLLIALGEAAALSAKGWALLAQEAREYWLILDRVLGISERAEFNKLFAERLKLKQREKEYESGETWAARNSLQLNRDRQAAIEDRMSQLQNMEVARQKAITEMGAAPAGQPPPGGGDEDAALEEFIKTRNAIRGFNQEIIDGGLAERGVLQAVIDKYDEKGAAIRQTTDDLEVLHAAAAAGNQRAVDALNAIAVAGGNAGKEVESISVLADQAARNIQSFTASLVDAAMAGQNMGDAITAALRRIAAELFTTMVLTGLGDWLKGKGGFLGKVGESISPTPTGKAAGGPVMGGAPYIVGEEGPELFVPRAGGMIVPAGEFGGSKVEINVDARGADPASAANILRAMGALESRIYEGLQRRTAPVPA